MEVKVFCSCGSKYKFDVEPVNERMPWPVNCPACGADGTQQSNEIIAQTLAANPPAPAPVPAYVPAPAPIAAAPPPPAPAPGGLRINKAAAAPPPAPAPIGAAPPPPGGPPRFTPATGRPLAPAKPKSSESMWAKIGGGALGAIVLGLIAFKWAYRFMRLSHAFSGAGLLADPEIADAINEMKEMNLSADNAVVLYVKHDDYRTVGQECIAFWKEKQQRNYQFIKPDQQSGDGAEYQLYPAHNGYVRIMSTVNWKDPMFESTAQHLSEKYSTIVFDEKDVDFSGDFVFGVYDQGSNVFHARMVVDPNGDGKDKTTVENVDWAKAHGYVPGKHKTKEFTMLDANRLTKQFGMKFWDENHEAMDTNYLVIAARK